MDAFEFFNPVRVIFGAGESTRIGAETAKLGKRALLVSYADHAFFTPLLTRVKASLEAAGVTVTPHFAITANPMMSQVRQGVALCKEHAVDVVIAVGGGSVMDATKIIAAGALYPHDLWKMIKSRHDIEVSIPPEKALPIVMLPTLPATSSEMNCGAVVTNDETVEKSYVFNEVIYPAVSIIDPTLTVGLPKYQTACGAVDAISHVIESYFNSADDTPLQDRLQESVIITIMELAEKLVQDPANVALRANIQWASVLAWNGWIQAGITPGSPMHQLGHVISARYNVTHGATLAIIMPSWMKYIYRQRLDRYVQFAERIFGIRAAGRNREEVALEGIACFEAFMKRLEVPTHLCEVGVPATAIDEMVEDVARVSFNAAGTLASRPAVGREGVRAVYEGALV